MVLVGLAGCSSEEPGEGAEAPIEAAKRGKQKHRKAKQAKHRKHMLSTEYPIGVDGPMIGTLRFTELPASGEDSPAMTQVWLDLSWSDEGSHSMDLGTFPGPCANGEPTPVGRKGAERTPMWAVRCGPDDAEQPIELYVLQVGAFLSAIQRAEPSEKFPDRPRYRPVDKIPLVNGAKLEPGS